MNKVGIVLRNARRNAGYTQEQVAEMLGISLWTYNRLENGRRTFDQDWIECLPQNLRLPVIRYLRSQFESEITRLETYIPARVVLLDTGMRRAS
jgi:DNA-binding XRE family transcriptional regulator